ncbi:MAG: nitronate monooxygenase [Burkholderiaceae bacterium]|nr:nitronate monooxygenase [Burkholderiaceae bacterium]
MGALHTPLCELFGVRYPIFGLTHSVEVALAIARAGGFPVLALARSSPDEAREHVARMRQGMAGGPWGINCLLTETLGQETDRDAAKSKLPPAHVDFVEGLRRKYGIAPPTQGNFFSSQVRSNTLNEVHADIALSSGATAFSTAIGAPRAMVARAKAAGMTTIASVGAPRHAQLALASGIDVLVAQGYDAGGHTGPIGTFSLVPQVVDAADGRPVIAAGGVGHGRHVAAALAMGAQGVWLGTAWLTATEGGTDAQLLAKLLAAGSADTVLTRAHSGKSARVLKSAWTDEWSRREAPDPLPMPLQQVLTGEAMASIDEHRIEALRYELCGQSIAWFNECVPVARIIERLVDEANAVMADLTRAQARAQ